MLFIALPRWTLTTMTGPAGIVQDKMGKDKCRHGVVPRTMFPLLRCETLH
jgi:hypothetical protein